MYAIPRLHSHRLRQETVLLQDSYAVIRRSNVQETKQTLSGPNRFTPVSKPLSGRQNMSAFTNVAPGAFRVPDTNCKAPWEIPEQNIKQDFP